MSPVLVPVTITDDTLVDDIIDTIEILFHIRSSTIRDDMSSIVYDFNCPGGEVQFYDFCRWCIMEEDMEICVEQQHEFGVDITQPIGHCISKLELFYNDRIVSREVREHQGCTHFLVKLTEL